MKVTPIVSVNNSTQHPRKTRINKLAVELCNIKLDIDKLRKKINNKVAKKDRGAIALAAKLAKLEVKKTDLETEFFEIL